VCVCVCVCWVYGPVTGTLEKLSPRQEAGYAPHVGRFREEGNLSMTCRAASSGVVDHWRFERNASSVRVEEAAVTPKCRWMSSELDGVSRKTDDPREYCYESPVSTYSCLSPPRPSGTEP
jgi:hypothetical protein